MVAGLDLDPSALQRRHHLQLSLPRDAAAALEVGAGIVLQLLRGARALGEEEELDLGCDQEDQACVGGAVEDPPQRPPAVAAIRLPVGSDDVAEEAGADDLGIGVDQGEGVEVRSEVHVRLHLAGHPLDRRAVEPLAILENLGQPAHRHRDVLNGAGDVGELELNLDHTSSLAAVDDVFFSVRHGSADSRGRWRRPRPPGSQRRAPR